MAGAIFTVGNSDGRGSAIVGWRPVNALSGSFDVSPQAAKVRTAPRAAAVSDNDDFMTQPGVKQMRQGQSLFPPARARRNIALRMRVLLTTRALVCANTGAWPMF
jgi:hypothetical protein